MLRTTYNVLVGGGGLSHVHGLDMLEGTHIIG